MSLGPILWKIHLRTPGYRLRTKAMASGPSWIPGWPAWPRVVDHTMVSKARLKSLERFARTIAVPGVFVECGVARGGTALLLGTIAKRKQRDLWLFDTFEGLPAPSSADPDFDRAVTWTGKCRGELSEVEALLLAHRVRERAHLIKGLFQHTLPTCDIPPIALLHLDGDWYDSTLTCLTHLWARVVPGGIVQVDDYGDWAGCRRAVDEFLGGTVCLHAIDSSGVWFQKPVRPEVPRPD